MKWTTVAIVAGLAAGAYWLYSRNRAPRNRAPKKASGGQRQYTPDEKRAALDYLQRVKTDPFFGSMQGKVDLIRAEIIAGTAGASARIDTSDLTGRIAAASRV